MTPEVYTRLPGRGSHLITVSRLYLGETHILGVESSGFMEQYRRFFLADIQAIVFRKTATGRIINAVTAVLAFGFLFAAVFTDGAPMVVFGFFSGTFGMVLLLNLILGPTCVAQVQTRGGIHPMPPLTRLRTTRRFVRRVLPRIEQAQMQQGSA